MRPTSGRCLCAASPAHLRHRRIDRPGLVVLYGGCELGTVAQGAQQAVRAVDTFWTCWVFSVSRRPSYVCEMALNSSSWQVLRGDLGLG
jgi:hypothetical protein